MAEKGYHRNLFYYDPKHIDLNVLRKNAETMTKGDRLNKPSDVTIHYHRRDEDCRDRKHEDYPAQL